VGSVALVAFVGLIFFLLRSHKHRTRNLSVSWNNHQKNSSQGARFYLKRVQRQEDHGLVGEMDGTGIQNPAELKDQIVRRPASLERSGSGKPIVSAQGPSLRVDGGNPFYVNW
jgi:hypothetical protein